MLDDMCIEMNEFCGPKIGALSLSHRLGTAKEISRISIISI